MIKQEDTKQPDLVEQIVCKPMGNLRKYPMRPDIGEMMIRLLMAKEVLKDMKNVPDKDKPFLYQVIEKRIQYCFTFKIDDPRLILFLAMIAESPGCAVMYLAYLQYWCKQNGVHVLDLETFCENIFPYGFPSQDDLGKLWDTQKVKRDGSGGSDNLLDYASAYQSIQLTELLWENLPEIEM